MRFTQGGEKKKDTREGGGGERKKRKRIGISALFRRHRSSTRKLSAKRKGGEKSSKGKGGRETEPPIALSWDASVKIIKPYLIDRGRKGGGGKARWIKGGGGGGGKREKRGLVRVSPYCMSPFGKKKGKERKTFIEKKEGDRFNSAPTSVYLLIFFSLQEREEKKKKLGKEGNDRF